MLSKNRFWLTTVILYHAMSVGNQPCKTVIKVVYDSNNNVIESSLLSGSDTLKINYFSSHTKTHYNRNYLLQSYTNEEEFTKAQRLLEAIFFSLDTLARYTVQKKGLLTKFFDIFKPYKKFSKEWHFEQKVDSEKQYLIINTLNEKEEKIITEDIYDKEFSKSAEIIYKRGYLTLNKLQEKNKFHQRSKSY